MLRLIRPERFSDYIASKQTVVPTGHRGLDSWLRRTIRSEVWFMDARSRRHKIELCLRAQFTRNIVISIVIGLILPFDYLLLFELNVNNNAELLDKSGFLQYLWDLKSNWYFRRIKLLIKLRCRYMKGNLLGSYTSNFNASKM